MRGGAHARGAGFGGFRAPGIDRPMAQPDLNDRPVSELIQLASQQTATLVRDEIRLAKLELSDKGKRLGAGAGMFGAASVVAVFGVGALVAALVAALATTLDTWLAALIVGGGLLALAGALALAGRASVRAATPPLPEEAIESTRHDVETVRDHVARR